MFHYLYIYLYIHTYTYKLRVCIERKGRTDLKELTDVIVEAGKPEICTAGWRHQEEMR